jgi:hypothetical protein
MNRTEQNQDHEVIHENPFVSFFWDIHKQFEFFIFSPFQDKT